MEEYPASITPLATGIIEAPLNIMSALSHFVFVLFFCLSFAGFSDATSGQGQSFEVVMCYLPSDHLLIYRSRSHLLRYRLGSMWKDEF